MRAAGYNIQRRIRQFFWPNLYFRFLSAAPDVKPTMFPSHRQKTVKTGNELWTLSFNKAGMKTEPRISNSLKSNFFFVSPTTQYNVKVARNLGRSAKICGYYIVEPENF